MQNTQPKRRPAKSTQIEHPKRRQSGFHQEPAGRGVGVEEGPQRSAGHDTGGGGVRERHADGWVREAPSQSMSPFHVSMSHRVVVFMAGESHGMMISTTWHAKNFTDLVLSRILGATMVVRCSSAKLVQSMNHHEPPIGFGERTWKGPEVKSSISSPSLKVTSKFSCSTHPLTPSHLYLPPIASRFPAVSPPSPCRRGARDPLPA